MLSERVCPAVADLVVDDSAAARIRGMLAVGYRKQNRGNQDRLFRAVGVRNGCPSQLTRRGNSCQVPEITPRPLLWGFMGTLEVGVCQSLRIIVRGALAGGETPLIDGNCRPAGFTFRQLSIHSEVTRHLIMPCDKAVLCDA